MTMTRELSEPEEITTPDENETSVATGTISTSVKSAVIWSLASYLVRYHGRSMNLDVSIVRPGGGQYFCVSIASRSTKREIF